MLIVGRDRSDNYPERFLPYGDESADKNLISRSDKATRGDVHQSGISFRVQIVHFDHSNPAVSMFPIHYCGLTGALGITGMPFRTADSDL